MTALAEVPLLPPPLPLPAAACCLCRAHVVGGRASGGARAIGRAGDEWAHGSKKKRAPGGRSPPPRDPPHVVSAAYLDPSRGGLT